MVAECLENDVDVNCTGLRATDTQDSLADVEHQLQWNEMHSPDGECVLGVILCGTWNSFTWTVVE